jgi:hypothetical protein
LSVVTQYQSLNSNRRLIAVWENQQTQINTLAQVSISTDHCCNRNYEKMVLTK